MMNFPSVKVLLILILFTTTVFFSISYISSADLLDVAEEYRVKADMLQREGRLDAAIMYYQKVISLDKTCVSAYNSLAICYEKKGWLRHAEKEYLKALEIDPKYAPSHYNLGIFYEKYGDIDKAVQHWTERLKLSKPGDPANLKVREKLRAYSPKELEQKEAEELAKSIIEQKDTNDLNKILGKQKYKTSEEKMQEFYIKGMQCYQQGDIKGAEEYFHKMIETLPISRKPVKK